MAKIKELQLQDYQTLAAIRHGLRQFLAFSESAAREAGISPVQHQALLAVMGMPQAEGVTVGALARYLGVRPHSAVGLVDRLAALKLLKRTGDWRDRRRVTLTLTGTAKAKLAALSAVHREELRQLSALLDPLLRALS